MTRSVPEDMTVQDCMVALAKGNPGALTVLIEMAKRNRTDLFIFMYEQEIEGPDIWILFKDENDQDIEHTIGDLELKMMLSGRS